jgi:hypothetical protein
LQHRATSRNGPRDDAGRLTYVIWPSVNPPR